MLLILIIKINLAIKITIINNNKINQTSNLVLNLIIFIYAICRVKKSSFLTLNTRQTFI